MSEKQTKEQVYNYRKIFKKPIVIYRLNDQIKLPVGVEIRRVAIAIVIGLLLWLLKIVLLDYITFGIINKQFILLIYFLVPMWFGSGFLSEERAAFNGKNVFAFTKDLIVFWWTVKRPHKRFNDERSIPYQEEKVSFNESKLAIMKERGTENAKPQKAVQNDIKEHVANEHGPSVGVLQNTEPNHQ
ncbi:TcpE family conjugal transfer membrane protein [Lactiplantibacillus plantarum]